MKQQADMNNTNQTNNTNNNNNNNTTQQTPTREHQISQAAKDKADAFRVYIERKYSKRKQEEKEKKENWDLIQKKMDDLKISMPEQELIKREILHKEAEQLRNKRKKISARDFEPITIIGRGAFGEVRVCRWKDTGEIVAMKKMNKHEMLHKNQVLHIRAERDVLATAHNPWIVELKCSFQDEKYLYLVMEYLPGGDLMTLLMKKDILSEEESKFYIAEAILAVESVHKLNYIHRDLKPDNILLDSRGHIKLSDFGLCKHTEIRPRKFEFKKMDDQQQDPILTKSNLAKKPNGFKRNRQLAYSTVGTPDYIAPEVFGQNGYTETVDWWSLGVILYEMLVGYPPFFSEDPSMTCQKILHWRKTLVIPAEANLSQAATDILRKLITDANERLGINGVEEIKAHPFFFGIDWKRIREKKAPNIPELKSEIDTSNFDKFDEEEPWYVEDTTKTKKARKDVNFIGYTFKRDIEAQRSLLVSALQELESNKASQFRPKLTQNPQTQNVKKDENPTNTSNSQIKKSASNLVGSPTGVPTNLGATQISSNNIANAMNTITQMQNHSTKYPMYNNQDSYNPGYNPGSKSPGNSTKQIIASQSKDKSGMQNFRPETPYSGVNEYGYRKIYMMGMQSPETNLSKNPMTKYPPSGTPTPNLNSMNQSGVTPVKNTTMYPSNISKTQVMPENILISGSKSIQTNKQGTNNMAALSQTGTGMNRMPYK